MPNVVRNPKLGDLISRLKALDNENEFDEVPGGWDGVSVKAITEAAVLLPLRGQDVWFPLKQLRCDAQDNVFASKWIIEQKGLS